MSVIQFSGACHVWVLALYLKPINSGNIKIQCKRYDDDWSHILKNDTVFGLKFSSKLLQGMEWNDGLCDYGFCSTDITTIQIQAQNKDYKDF